MNTYEHLILDIDLKINELKDSKELIESNRSVLEKLELPGTIYLGFIDFDRLNHSEVIQVISAFGGTWEKDINIGGTTIDYVLKDKHGSTKVRCWSGEPPPACKLVDEEVNVPATTRKVRRLVCSGHE